MGKKLYTYDLNDRVNEQLPKCVRDAMNNSGWNALGIYELVKDEIEKGKRKAFFSKSNQGNQDE